MRGHKSRIVIILFDFCYIFSSCIILLFFVMFADHKADWLLWLSSKAYIFLWFLIFIDLSWNKMLIQVDIENIQFEIFCTVIYFSFGYLICWKFFFYFLGFIFLQGSCFDNKGIFFMMNINTNSVKYLLR